MLSTIITSTSSKGGSGTTIIALNLAYLAAVDSPEKVLFLQLTPGGDAASHISSSINCNIYDFFEFMKAQELNTNSIRSIATSFGPLDIVCMPQIFLEKRSIPSKEIQDVLTELKKVYQYIFIDCPPTADFTLPIIEFTDAVLYVSNFDIPGIQLLNQYHEYASRHNFDSKLHTVINQVPKNMSQKKLEKHIGRTILTTLPTDTEAIWRTTGLGTAYVTEKKYVLTERTVKLWERLKKEINNL